MASPDISGARFGMTSNGPIPRAAVIAPSISDRKFYRPKTPRGPLAILETRSAPATVTEAVGLKLVPTHLEPSILEPVSAIARSCYNESIGQNLAA